MIAHSVKNFNELATTENRRLALQIVESGLDAINTERVINSSVLLTEDTLFIKGKEFNLAKYKKIKVIGFGKASSNAALALEKILGSRIEKGVVVGIEKIDCDYIETFAGTHPRPSQTNALAGEKIYEIIKDSSAEDLIIVLVSGGGSALLCYPRSECDQSQILYDSFLKSGKTIAEINTVRKHLSLLKGGGLAKIAYPATIIGLIFSDVPGDNFENVASGPTYKDVTTINDAKKIIAENNLGNFNLVETPKEDKYFDNVHNFVLVSNKIAVKAMAEKAQELGLETNIISTDLYDEVNESLGEIFSAKKENCIILAAGEPRIVVLKNEGKGGRNLHMGLKAVKNEMIDENSVFISLASDGMDNSDVAGAIVDKNTLEKMNRLNLNADEFLNRFDSYDFFKKTGDMIITGPTGANVSDLMILLNKK
jgi:glycerate-2-kinase